MRISSAKFRAKNNEFISFNGLLKLKTNVIEMAEI